MTISSTSHRMDYTGNGATSSYSYNFRIFSDTDLLVTKRDTSDIETTLVLNTDYTVSGAGDSNGSITLTTALALNNHLTIRRVRPLTQGTDIRNQGDFYPEIHEDAFDHFVMIDQQQQEEIDRAIRLPETVTGVDASMPLPEALHWPRWDATGTALENVTSADISAAVTTVNSSLTLSGSELSVTIPVRQGLAGGTVDAITASVTPAPASLTNNLTVWIETAGANTSTTPTFNLNGLGAKTIVKWGGTALVAGDIKAASDRMILVYDDSLDKWVLLNPASPPAVPGIQSGQYVYAADSGAADVYVATLTPAVTTYTTGMEVNVKITNANATTTPTINVNGLGAKTIKRGNSIALYAGDLPANHQAKLRYNGTDFILLNPALVPDSSITFAKVADGIVVQVVKTQTGAVATGTTVMPVDDTIPQNTEGDEYMTLAITPKATTNILVIDVVAQVSVASAQRIGGAIFQDSTANALAATSVGSTTNGWDAAIIPIYIRHTMVAGTTSATTFKFRAGAVGATTTTFNGQSGARLFGGVMASSITITEYKAS